MPLINEPVQFYDFIRRQISPILNPEVDFQIKFIIFGQILAVSIAGPFIFK
jgi:hypothetical protein